MKGIQDGWIIILAYLIYEDRARRREGPNTLVSVCLCFKANEREREGETKSHRLKGEGKATEASKTERYK